jgi:hypothetical protein
METPKPIIVAVYIIPVSVAIPIGPVALILVRYAVPVTVYSSTNFITVIYAVTVAVNVAITVNLHSAMLLLPAPTLRICITIGFKKKKIGKRRFNEFLS